MHPVQGLIAGGVDRSRHQKFAALECMVQEARGTLRTLQHERELAERIERGIKQLRTRTSPGDEGRPPATA